MDTLNPHALGLQSTRAMLAANYDRRLDRLERAQGGIKAISLAMGTVSTVSTSFVSLSGPSVFLRVPEYSTDPGRGFMYCSAEAEISCTGNVQLAVYNSDLNKTVAISDVLVGTGSFRLWTTTRAPFGVTPGLRNFELRYRSISGANAQFRNRRLLVEAA